MFRKILFLVVLIQGYHSVFSQIFDKIEDANLKLTITVENKVWNKQNEAIVTLTIENLSKNKITAHPLTGFRLDDRVSDGRPLKETDGVYWSPISLNKKYKLKVKGCENDLDNKKILDEERQMNYALERNLLNLDSGKKIEVRFRLAKLCWAHSLQKRYPFEPLYSKVKPKKYKLVFTMQLFVDASDKVPTKYIKSLESNQLEIEIKFGG